MQGVHYVIDKLGQALASAEQEIERLQSRIRDLEHHASQQAEAQKPVDVSE